MLTSELEALVSATPQAILDFDLYLACPDPVVSDNADEQTATIGCVELAPEHFEARIYPPFSPKETEGSQIYRLSELMSALKPADGEFIDLRLVVEIPIIREDSQTYSTSLVPIVAMHVGTDAQEVWLLLAPVSDFPAGALPS
jgi:hypothetical protein